MTFLSSCGILCNILPEAHVLTGCDTTSAMHVYGIGKRDSHESHHQIATRIAKQINISRSKIPPSEASFIQHVKLAAW